MTTKRQHENALLRIILDSNALFVPLQLKIDIFEALETLLGRKFEPILLSSIKQELETIAEKGPPKMRKWASYALKLAEKCAFLEVEDKTAKSPDDAIVEVAKKGNCLVFTNDRELRKRLRNISVPVIYVRQKSRLEIDGRA
ncbi:nucleotide-binding protein [Candidatus Bathyarchaeota archaeon]|nr:nucleotide-binding protein [Candidatus Bathyarchaeota archaeon]